MPDRRLDVLVVDDEFLIRWAIVRTLSRAGHRVREAADAAAALALLRHGAIPDVVLLDYRLPDTHALDLLAAVRQLAPGSAVVMMSADPAAMLADAFELGAASVMQKPFDMDAVEPALIRARVARQHATARETHV